MMWSLKSKIIFVTVVAILGALFLFPLSRAQLPLSFFTSPEINSPGDWVKDEQIKVYTDKVVLDVRNATWVGFTNTNSMDPFLDQGANALEIVPEDPYSIKAGDIISYQSRYGVIIHRVIEQGEDEEGVYYMVKGDNNTSKDPLKVRFEDVKGVLVAVIY
ncbi:TPA: hypothetical protein HA242_04315 [Candidatus Woesearchaeota archaeon]|nr:hypothetical protein [Candidatus Woesearchaeota archaeon]HIH12923.1 hypothetical protein [Candidatus Woesearchaeota archaeon]